VDFETTDLGHEASRDCKGMVNSFRLLDSDIRPAAYKAFGADLR
jgi:hypothetical protein